MKNLELAKILYNIADILELKEIPFKPMAYRRAARAIETLSEDIEEIAKEEKLEDIPGVGKSIAEKIIEFLKTGKIKAYEQLKKQVKLNIEELNAVPGLGPKKIKILYKKLGIKNLRDLEKAIKAKKLQKLAGFGEETEKNLLRGIRLVKSRPKRFLYAHALPIASQLKENFSRFDFVDKIEAAGSFRRGKETVGDIDILIISRQPEKVAKAFVSLPDVKTILAEGATKCSVRLANGLQVDLRILEEKEWGSALNYFIGSKQHNIELRKFALKKGYTLSEYGLFRIKSREGRGREIGEKNTGGKGTKEETRDGEIEGRETEGKEWVAGRTEEEIYDRLGLQFIPPELRENTGEIEAARQKKLPRLVEVNDIKGVFHNHSDWTDGDDSLLKMAQKAEEMKFKFISFNDHYGAIGITNPLNEKRLAKYLEEIEKVRKKVGIRVFSGIEIDILKDGNLPLSAEKLRKLRKLKKRKLDVVIAAVHTSLKMPAGEMTKRICYAMENYPIDILAHPTGRLLNEREPSQLNFEKVFEAAAKKNVFLEINAQPARMDLCGEHIQAAKKAGCKFALSTDAHSADSLGHYPLGILMARRGWLEKKDLLNCWETEKIEKELERIEEELGK